MTTPDRPDERYPMPSKPAANGDTYPHELVGPAADAPTMPTPDEVAAARPADVGQLREVDGDQLVAAPSWRLAGSLEQLRAEANAANPNRDHSSDGTIGDTAHAARVSDHNPDAAGVVRALDLDIDGLDLAAAFERFRLAAHAGQLPQLADGGYLILNRRITSPTFDRWNVYTGSNPHVSHGHTSCSRSAAAYDSQAPWGLAAPAPAPAPTPPPAQGPGWTGPDLRGSALSLRGERGANGGRVQALQNWLRIRYPLYAKHLEVDGWWGDQTTGVIAEFGRRSQVNADGLNIGPQLALKLYRAGFRG